MVNCALPAGERNSWIIDSGCSNHMSGMKKLFQDLDSSTQQTVRLGNDKELQVQGKEL